MAKGGRKREPYAGTKVPWMQTQGHIIALLGKHGISDYRFVGLGSRGMIGLEFRWVPHPEQPGLTVRIVVPDVTDENRNARYRALYWYLKSKFEALQFGFVEFVREFLPYIVTGSGQTVYEVLGPRIAQALESGELPDVLALPPGEP